MFTKIKHFMRAHKIITSVIIIVLVVIGYYWYKADHGAVTVTKYVVQDATSGTIVSSVSATGQVDPVTEIDVKPQVSENVTQIYVKVGDHVSQGQPLVQLDPTNEQEALNQAQLSVQSAQLNLEQLQQTPTTTLLSDQDAVTKGIQALATASTTLVTDYQNGFDTLSSAFVSLQTVMTGLQNFVQGYDISKTQEDPDAYVSIMPTYLQDTTSPYRDAIDTSYAAAAAAYATNLNDYRAADRNGDPATLDALYAETYSTAQSISTAVKSANDLINYVITNYPKGSGYAQLPAITTTFQTNFGNYTNTVSGEISDIGGVITGISNDKNSLASDVISLEEASETLSELVAGPTQLNLLSQQISIESAQNSLQTAQQNLADTTIRAPISGIVSAMDAVVGETVASPAVSIVGTGNLAEVTLNEIDAAKVAVGDPATLTFDALPDVSLAGSVVEVDPVGTVSQGVVNYNVQVGFSQTTTSTDDQVKPGMSVTATIVTQVAQDVVAVPNGAVVSSGGSSYILEPSTPIDPSILASSAAGGVTLAVAPKRVPVTTGLSNDTMTEITSGVNVGDQIITQTIMTSASTPSTAAPGGTSALRLLGGGAAAAGGFGGGGGFTGGAARTTGVRTGG